MIESTMIPLITIFSIISTFFTPSKCHLLRTAKSVSILTSPSSSSDIINKARNLINGNKFYSWNQQLSGSAWEFGTCSNSTAFGTPQFGARWPLKAGWVTWYDQLPAGDGVTAYIPKKVFGVLNQKYFSSYTNEEDAMLCKKPINEPILVSDLTGANQGGEPVLISTQNEDTPFCIHLRTGDQGGHPYVNVVCMENRVERRDWLDYLKDVIKTNMVQSSSSSSMGTATPTHIDQEIFPQAPRTICSFVGEDRLCLTSTPYIPDETDKNNVGMDDVELIKSGWIKSFPITGINEQIWQVEKVVSSSSSSSTDENKVTKVNICSSNKKCLTVLNNIQSTGQVPKLPRKFIDCPGGNLKCFSMKHIKIGMTPTDHDTDVCENECRNETLCQGWVYTRPLATGTKYAKCCLKKRDMSLTCGENRCCDSHMNSETEKGAFILNGAKVPKVSNSIKMVTFSEINLYQQWLIVPEKETELTRGKSLAKLKLGDLCISIDQTTSETMLIMDECTNGIVFNFESFE